MKVTYEINMQPFTITVKPPSAGVGTGHPDDYEHAYTVEAADHENRVLYVGAISAQLAPYLERTCDATISDILINGAKNILDNRFNRRP